MKPRYCFHWYAVGGFGHLQICAGSAEDACRVVLFLVAEADCQITASVLGGVALLIPLMATSQLGRSCGWLSV